MTVTSRFAGTLIVDIVLLGPIVSRLMAASPIARRDACISSRIPSRILRAAAETRGSRAIRI